MISTFVTLKDFIIFAQTGLVCGVIYDILFIFKFITKKNFLVVNVLDFLFCLFSGFLLIFCIFNFKQGYFALFQLISFCFGFVFEQIIIKNLFTSPIKWVYNKAKLRKSIKSFFLNE